MNIDKIYAEQIATEYSAKKSSKVVALRKLDQRAKRPAEIFAFTFGIICALVLGTGMCMSMGIIGGGASNFVAGIVIGLVGIIGVSVNYVLYKKILENGKQKYASDIIRLSKEISEEE